MALVVQPMHMSRTQLKRYINCKTVAITEQVFKMACSVLRHVKNVQTTEHCRDAPVKWSEMHTMQFSRYNHPDKAETQQNSEIDSTQGYQPMSPVLKSSYYPRQLHLSSLLSVLNGIKIKLQENQLLLNKIAISNYICNYKLQLHV